MSFSRIALASGLQNATGQGAKMSVQAGTMGQVTANVKTVTGTTPVLNLYLQGSDDDGTTWYDLFFDSILKTSTAAAGGTVATNSRNINGATNITAVEKHVGIVKHLPAKHVRAAWIISGTFAGGEGFTFDATLDLK